eukprot:30822-Eustigmatos_ZCMA.PRE.1
MTQTPAYTLSPDLSCNQSSTQRPPPNCAAPCMDEEAAEPGGLHIQDGRPRGRSIIRAAETGDLSTIETMIARVPSLTDYTDEHGQTALMWASYRGHLSIVK